MKKSAWVVGVPSYVEMPYTRWPLKSSSIDLNRKLRKNWGPQIIVLGPPSVDYISIFKTVGTHVATCRHLPSILGILARGSSAPS